MNDSHYKNMRERKRARFARPASQHKPSLLVPVFVVAGVALLAGATILLSSWLGADGPSLQDNAAPVMVQMVADTDGTIRLPLAMLGDGRARFYTYQANGVSIEYFVLQSSDGVVRSAFNTCDVCYQARQGYRQERDEMVCNNCGQRFPSAMVNEVSGGCNPAPLARTVEEDELIIRVDDLIAGTAYFE